MKDYHGIDKLRLNKVVKMFILCKVFRLYNILDIRLAPPRTGVRVTQIAPASPIEPKHEAPACAAAASASLQQ
jgi:hypothetical protein